MAKNIIIGEGAFDSSSRTTANNNFADVSVSTAQVDVTASATLVDATGLTTGTLLPGTYRYDAKLITAAGGTGGLKLAIKQNNGLTFTSLNATTTGAVAGGGNTQISASTTDAATLFTQAAAVISAAITGTFVVATTGTAQIQFAQNTSNGTPTSILLGSRFEVTRIGNS